MESKFEMQDSKMPAQWLRAVSFGSMHLDCLGPFSTGGCRLEWSSALLG